MQPDSTCSSVLHVLGQKSVTRNDYDSGIARYNSYLRIGLEFDCNQQALLDRGARPLIDFNVFRNYTIYCNDRHCSSQWWNQDFLTTHFRYNRNIINQQFSHQKRSCLPRPSEAC